jgi:hypothetical protein
MDGRAKIKIFIDQTVNLDRLDLFENLLATFD